MDEVFVLPETIRKCQKQNKTKNKKNPWSRAAHGCKDEPEVKHPKCDHMTLAV